MLDLGEHRVELGNTGASTDLVGVGEGALAGGVSGLLLSYLIKPTAKFKDRLAYIGAGIGLGGISGALLTSKYADNKRATEVESLAGKGGDPNAAQALEAQTLQNKTQNKTPSSNSTEPASRSVDNYNAEGKQQLKDLEAANIEDADKLVSASVANGTEKPEDADSVSELLLDNLTLYSAAPGSTGADIPVLAGGLGAKKLSNIFSKRIDQLLTGKTNPLLDANAEATANISTGINSFISDLERRVSAVDAAHLNRHDAVTEVNRARSSLNAATSKLNAADSAAASRITEATTKLDAAAAALDKNPGNKSLSEGLSRSNKNLKAVQASESAKRGLLENVVNSAASAEQAALNRLNEARQVIETGATPSAAAIKEINAQLSAYQKDYNNLVKTVIKEGRVTDTAVANPAELRLEFINNNMSPKEMVNTLRNNGRAIADANGELNSKLLKVRASANATFVSALSKLGWAAIIGGTGSTLMDASTGGVAKATENATKTKLGAYLLLTPPEERIKLVVGDKSENGYVRPTQKLLEVAGLDRDKDVNANPINREAAAKGIQDLIMVSMSEDEYIDLLPRSIKATPEAVERAKADYWATFNKKLGDATYGDVATVNRYPLSTMVNRALVNFSNIFVPKQHEVEYPYINTPSLARWWTIFYDR